MVWGVCRVPLLHPNKFSDVRICVSASKEARRAPCHRMGIATHLMLFNDDSEQTVTAGPTRLTVLPPSVLFEHSPFQHSPARNTRLLHRERTTMPLLPLTTDSGNGTNNQSSQTV